MVEVQDLRHGHRTVELRACVCVCVRMYHSLQRPSTACEPIHSVREDNYLPTSLGAIIWLISDYCGLEPRLARRCLSNIAFIGNTRNLGNLIPWIDP